MRSLLDQEENEQGAPEITLSTATLLSIFFGLVVVCGVFFGLGYSVGRRTTPPMPASAAPAEPTTPVADSHPTKPSPQQANLTAAAPAADPQPETDNESTGKQADAESSQPSDSRTVTVTEPEPAPVRSKPTPVIRPAPASIVPASTSVPAPGASMMVQVAAVSHQEDAEVLVSALRKRGYSVNIHTEPQDRLLHVQVGPFASRAEALMMKQKLLADGYNAFLK